MSLNVYLIHPGAAWSTADVHTGMLAGLEANGCNVRVFRLDESLAFYGNIFEAAKRGGLVWEDTNRPNMAGFASLKAIAEIAYERPDVLISVSGHNLHHVVPLTARRLGIPSVVYCTESPYFGDKEHAFAKAYDLVLTNERMSVEGFQAACPDRIVRYLPHAYNPKIHKPGPVEPAYASDVFFVGSGFQERKRLFDAVDWEGLSFVRKGFMWTPEEDAGALNLENVLPNEEAAKYYRAAGVCLNHHRTTTIYGSGKHISHLEAGSLGPRAYEIAACGGFQLSDDSRPELQEIFGDTVPTYRTHSSLDLEQKIRYYLDRPGEREELARQQRAAVAPHTWEARARTMLEWIGDMRRPTKKRARPARAEVSL